jgi:hypothetical protein
MNIIKNHHESLNISRRKVNSLIQKEECNLLQGETAPVSELMKPALSNT